jgi:hypothetical protein
MGKAKPAGLLLPVQAAVERTASYAHVADGPGTGASQQTNQFDLWGTFPLIPVDPVPPINWFGPLSRGFPPSVWGGPPISGTPLAR